MSSRWFWNCSCAASFLLVVLTRFTTVLADENGMDMSMDGPMDLAVGQMLPYLHFTSGDNLWFLGWVPKSAGAMVGTCIGLFLLAIIDRWIAACRSLMEAHWQKRTIQLIVEKNQRAANNDEPVSVVKATGRPPLLPSSSEKSIKFSNGDAEVVASPELLTVEALKDGSASIKRMSRGRISAPFIASHDIPRGIAFAGQAALGYAFMLAIMTFQASFVISIVVGLGVGETLFGRYRAHSL